MGTLTIHDKVLLENGVGESYSPSFTVSEGDPAILTLTSTSDNIPVGLFVRIQVLQDQQFINYSLPDQGYKSLKRDVRHIKLVSPGVYRVHRPDISRQNVQLGVAIRTSKINTDEVFVKVHPSATPEPSGTPQASYEATPTPTPTPSRTPTRAATLTPTPTSTTLPSNTPRLEFVGIEDDYVFKTHASVYIPLETSETATLRLWYNELPLGLVLTETDIRGKCRVPGEYEVGIEAIKDGTSDQILIKIVIE